MPHRKMNRAKVWAGTWLYGPHLVHAKRTDHELGGHVLFLPPELGARVDGEIPLARSEKHVDADVRQQVSAVRACELFFASRRV